MADVLGSNYVAEADSTVGRFRLAEAARVLDEKLDLRKKKTDLAFIRRVQRAYEAGTFASRADQARAKHYKFRAVRRLPRRSYQRANDGRVYLRVEGKPFRSLGKITKAELDRLWLAEKEQVVHENLRRYLQISAKEATSIIGGVKRRVRADFRRFAKSARYKKLPKSSKEKLTADRWNRWALRGMQVMLGSGEGSP